jgi:hypothetical protein
LKLKNNNRICTPIISTPSPSPSPTPTPSLKYKTDHMKLSSLKKWLVIMLVSAFAFFLFGSIAEAHIVNPDSSGNCPPGHVLIPGRSGIGPICGHPSSGVDIAIDVGARIITAPITAIAFAINFFLGVGIGLAGYILEWAINSRIPYVTAPATFTGTWPITFGWGIVRDFANMGFALGIAIIAIATILRLETYGMRQLLWKLILAAILVNFSLVIMGVIVDAANLIMNFFIQPLVGFQGVETSAKLSWNLLTKSGATKLMEAPTATTGELVSAAIGGFAANVVQIIVAALFSVIFMLVLFIVMVALAIMMVLRRVIIWVLAIIAPLAFLFWVFPGTRKYWTEWWDVFLRWTIFGPAAIFFIYLSVTIIGNFTQNPAYFQIETGKGIPGVLGQLSDITMSWILIFVTFMILLFMSLMAAQKFGIYGANIAMGFATSAARLPERALARQGQRTLTESRIGQWAERTFAGRPIVGGVADAIAKARGRVAERMEAQEKAAAKRSAKANAAILAGRMVSSETAMGIIDHLAKEGKLSEVPKETLRRYQQTAERLGRAGKIYNAYPTLAPDVKEKAAGISTKNITKVAAGEFADPTVARTMTAAKVRQIVTHGTPEQVENLQRGLQAAGMQDLLAYLDNVRSPGRQMRSAGGGQPPAASATPAVAPTPPRQPPPAGYRWSAGGVLVPTEEYTPPREVIRYPQGRRQPPPPISGGSEPPTPPPSHPPAPLRERRTVGGVIVPPEARYEESENELDLRRSRTTEEIQQREEAARRLEESAPQQSPATQPPRLSERRSPGGVIYPAGYYPEEGTGPA